MNTLWQQYVSAVLGEDNQSDAAKKTRVNQTTLGRWIRGEVRPTNAANVAAFAQDYGRNVLEAFVAAELLDEASASKGLSDLDRAFLRKMRRRVSSGADAVVTRAARKDTRKRQS